jgi:hypothetical protein
MPRSHIQAHVGVQRGADAREWLAEHRLPCFWIASTSGWLPASGFMALASSMRLMSTVMPGTLAAACDDHRRMVASTSAGFSSGIMRRSSLKVTLPWHHVGVGAALDAADVQVRVGDAFDRRT